MTPDEKPEQRYVVRLEAGGGSPHFRETTLRGPSPEMAAAHCEQSEREICAFRMSQEQLDAVLEEKQAAEAAGGQLTGRSKGLLHAHSQTKPYTVVSVKGA